MRTRALRADILMLLTAMLWGTVFIAQNRGMEHVGPFLFSGTRFILATLVLLPLFFWRPGGSPPQPMNRGLLLGGLLMGLVLSVATNLQQVGLMFTSVTNSGFITGLYVIIVPLLGMLFGQKTGLGTWTGAGLAVIGMFLLSVGENFQVASGDWLQLAGAVLWGVHVLLISALASRYDPLRLSVLQIAVCAVFSSVLALIFEDISLASIQLAAPEIIYGGMVGVVIGFTLQVIAQRDAIASHAAVILSLEAVFAAIAGAWFLDESLTMRGYIGCGLMLAGMLVAQLWATRKVEPVTA
jgi:drug/metabolite transporter (DMT)-like permease